MMDHVHKDSKIDPNDVSATEGEQPVSYYYDDATNYEPYREEDDDDDEDCSAPPK
jgi:hypothetical protein